MSSHNRKEVACSSWPFSLKQLFLIYQRLDTALRLLSKVANESWKVPLT